jgi:hypothetical protein
MGVDVFFGGAAGFERRTLAAREGNDVMAAVAAGDLDGDGKTDVAAFPTAAEAWIFLSSGGREFARETTSAAELALSEDGCSGYTARIADVDGEGRAEIVATFAGDPGARDLFGQPPPKPCRSGGSVRVWKVSSTSPD